MTLSSGVQARREGREFWIERDPCSPSRPYQLRRRGMRLIGDFIAAYKTEAAAEAALEVRSRSAASQNKS